MNQYIEQSRQLAYANHTPIVLVLVREELAPQSAAHHEREPDESSGPAAN